MKLRALFLCAIFTAVPLASHAAGQDPGVYTPQNSPQMFEQPKPIYKNSEKYKRVCSKKRDSHGDKVKTCRYKKRK